MKRRTLITVSLGIVAAGLTLAAHRSPTLIGRETLRVFGQGRMLATDPPTNRFYVAPTGGMLTAYDADTLEPHLNISADGPIGLVFNTVRRKGYVLTARDRLAVIDLDTSFPLSLTNALIEPRKLVIDNVSGRFYILNQQFPTATNGVGVWDSDTDQLFRFVSLFSAEDLRDLEVNPRSGRVYALDRGRPPTFDSRLYVINGTTLMVDHVVPLPRNVGLLHIHEATDRVLVPSGGTDELVVIDGATGTIETVLPGLAGRPLATNSTTDRLYVRSSSRDELVVLDATTLAEVASVPMPIVDGMMVYEEQNVLYLWSRKSLWVFDGARNRIKKELDAGCVINGLDRIPRTDRVYGICDDAAFGRVFVIGEPGDPMRRDSDWY